MNDQDDSNEVRDENSQRKSRLDLEVEEILRMSDNIRPFPDPKTRQKRERRLPTVDDHRLQSSMPLSVKKVFETPLLLALGFAILSFVIADASPLLASLTALVAVIFVLLPIVQRYRRPSAATETKMWRGRIIESRSSPDSLIESLKHWLRSRKP